MSAIQIPPISEKKPASTSSHRATYLFFLSLAVYLLTRLVRLPDFPIYFFTDEAIQAQHAADLIAHDFRSPEGVWLPTFFENGGQYNLSLSVYIQVLPTLLFGKSVWVTRGVSALLSLSAAVFMALTLKDIFRIRNWWLGALLLAAVPAWFLHSRTAFETVLMASLYAGFLYFYLRYRKGQDKSLYTSLVFGALAFYAYSPGQVIVVVTGAMLLIADARYHWEHRKTTMVGLIMLIVLCLPYLRHALSHKGGTLQHLALLNSYWVKPIPLYEKILTYFGRYLKGLNPIYWFSPNPSFIERLFPELSLPTWLFSYLHDLARHTMKGYGHLLWITLPFWAVGLTHTIKRFKNSAHRVLLLATLAAPSGAAVADWGITRGLVFIIPTTIITALGIEALIEWLERKRPTLRYEHLAGVFFIVFAFLSLWMLGDSLRNGPTWYDDYSLTGMQYGGQQVFTRSVEIAQAQPTTTVYVSSTWANGTDVLMRYFTDDLPNVRMGNINAWGLYDQPLDRSMLFVMTREDLDWIYESGKFRNITVEETLPYPDGRTGFYFVRLEYVEHIADILAAERVERQKLLVDSVIINGQVVEVQYPVLDINEIQHAFDGDPTTLIRTLEANPLRMILSFPEPIQFNQVTVIIGGTPTEVSLVAHLNQQELKRLSESVGADVVTREIRFNFNSPQVLDQITLEVRNTQDDDAAHVHLWEVIIN